MHLESRSRETKGMIWCVYMLRLSNGTICVGHTNDLHRRFSEHSSARGSKATRDSSPVEPIYTEAHPDRLSAVRRERQLKKWTKAKKLALAQGDLEQLHQLSKCRSRIR